MPNVIRVGIADDDAAIRFTVGRLVENSQGLQLVASVEDGSAAVALAQSGRIDVLILDVEMPNMNGREALRLIRDLAPAVRVVMHSSRPASTNAPQMLAMGAAAYLEKPCTPARLVEAVRQAAQAAIKR